MKTTLRSAVVSLLAATAMGIASLSAAESNNANPKPAAPATTKPLKVFILAGQSNMQGHVNVSTFDSMADDPKTAPILKEMRDADGKPRVCKKVWISSIGCAGDDTTEQKGLLTAGFGASPKEIGPEFTFGIYMEKLGEPILLIKTSWGGKSLHTDFRPPSAGPYLWSNFEMERRKASIEKDKADKIKETGVCYRLMISHVKKVLGDIKRVVPEYDPKQGDELAGFVWFQGFNDLVSGWTYDKGNQPGGYDMYATLLAQFIRDVRKDLSAPKLPFVIGVMGIGGAKEDQKPGGQMYFRQAQVAAAALPEFKGNVVAVPTAPYWDDELEALQGRMEACWPKVDARVTAEKDTSWKNKMKVMAENFTPEEWKRLQAGVSNGGYHYLGAAKIMGPIGKAFAEAMVEVMKQEQPAVRVKETKRFGSKCLELQIGDVQGFVIQPSEPAAAAPQAELTRDQRIQWWREARFGMFIHWGLYAIPGGVWKDEVHATGYSEWIMFDEKIPAKEYAKLAGKFNPVKFDAKAWAALAKKAGMKYMVLTTKHHDGFSMFQSSLTPYNVVDATPFKRDVTRELSDACRDSGMRFGCYYSIDRDWYRPQGPGNRYKQANVWDYPDSKREDFDRYFTTFAKPQVEELLKKYRPDLLWFDEIDMKTDAQVEDLYQSIRRLRPECLINSRIKDCGFPAKIPPPHCDYISTGDNEIADKNLGFEWENPGSMNTSYGYSANDHNWVSAAEIVTRLVEIVSKGGNYLLNVGPTPEGLIPQPCIDRLAKVGEWMEVNGEAIYGTSPWRVFHEKDEASGCDIRFTAKGNSVYVFCPFGQAGKLNIKALGKEQLPDQQIVSVSMLGFGEKIKWSQTAGGLTLTVPPAAPSRFVSTYRIELRKCYN